MDPMQFSGLLLVTKAASCQACALYEDRGLFNLLLSDLIVDDVVQMELTDMSGFDTSDPNHEVLNIDRSYPSFKYMAVETYDNLSDMTTREALSKMCFFNGKIVDGVFVHVNDYRTLTVDTLQQFCDASAIELSGPRRPSKKTSVRPIPKYTRK